MAIGLFDTYILIDFLKGYQPAIDETTYWDEAVISTITWMEIMAGANDDDRIGIIIPPPTPPFPRAIDLQFD